MMLSDTPTLSLIELKVFVVVALRGALEQSVIRKARRADFFKVYS